MIRISKLADYSTVIMSYIATQSERAHNAKAISSSTNIALPTVSKLLKSLTKANLLTSQRGVRGGYQLTRPPQQISVAEIIAALDGRIALTECSHSQGLCMVEQHCAIRQGWQSVSDVVRRALMKVSLAEMLRTTVANQH